MLEQSFNLEAVLIPAETTGRKRRISEAFEDTRQCAPKRRWTLDQRHATNVGKHLPKFVKLIMKHIYREIDTKSKSASLRDLNEPDATKEKQERHKVVGK